MGLSSAACDTLIEVLNMEALGGSDQPTSTSVHTLQLAGLVGGSGKVLTRARMTFAAGEGVMLEVSVRAESEPVCRLIISTIA